MTKKVWCQSRSDLGKTLIGFPKIHPHFQASSRAIYVDRCS